MSEQRAAYRLSSAAQLVQEDEAWVAYDAAGTGRLRLDADEVAACLMIAAGGAEDSGTLRRLIAKGILVRAGEDDAPFDRALWVSRGWSAAYDFALSLYGSSEQAPSPRLVKDSALPGVHGGIIEHYPPAPTAPPLCRDALLSCLREAGLSDIPSPLEAAVCAVSVDDMAPGWYRWDGGAWPGARAMPATADLERIAPVAFGRAGYAVQALVIVTALHPAAEMLRPRAYAHMLVTGGTAVSRLEGAANDAGLSCRGNYAVDSSVASWLGITPVELLPVGAVALGGR